MRLIIILVKETHIHTLWNEIITLSVVGDMHVLKFFVGGIKYERKAV